MKSKDTINGLSLFANVGIGETYIHKHGVEIKVANELLKDRCDFYEYLYPDTEVICGDISNKKIYKHIIKMAKKYECKFIMATPPCQGMSVAGKKDSQDERNLLIKYVIDVIKDLCPKFILIENVPSVLTTDIEISSKIISIKDYIYENLSKLGYKVNHAVIDAANYGTPQYRRRAIFLASNVDYWNFPEKQKQITLKEAIGHLPSLESGEDSGIPFHKAKTHNERHIECMSHTPEGKSAFDNVIHYPKRLDGKKIVGYNTTYKRMHWDKPAYTVTMANGAISSQNNVHPGRPLGDGLYSDARVLTLKELFIVTGLPDEWQPPPWASDSLVRKVIGECLLPKLVERLLETMPKN